MSVDRIRPGRWVTAFAVALSLAFAAGCDEVLPIVAIEELPGEPVSVELAIPWSEFASALEIFGGYGSASDVGEGVVANGYAGTLSARTLIRFADYPSTATVRDSTGTERPDSDLTYVGGRLVAFFDTIASTSEAPVTLGLGATETEWDPTTTSWEFAIDTINDQRAWGEPGAGPVIDLGEQVWDRSAGDSVVFALDSAAVALWSDGDDPTSGARISLVDVGDRLQMNGAVLRLDVRPSINQDTIIELTAGTRAVTFVFDPQPVPPPGGIRVGGTPSWRTILDAAIPTEVDGPAELCAVVTCPYTIDPVQISFASLVLTSRASEPAFEPTDSIRLDVRPVYDRGAMPKAPLGPSLIEAVAGRSVGPDLFGEAPGQRIELPFTTFARDLLRGEDDNGNPVPTTLALISVIEPFSIAYASFDGVGDPGEPFLRLVLTIGPPVELP